MGNRSRKAEQKYYKTHREEILVKSREKDKQERFGLSQVEFEDLRGKKIAEQGGVCALCGQPFVFEPMSNGKAPRLDHNHKTGKIRGVVHDSCNRGIGFLGDTAESVQKAVVYLKKYDQ